jgi:hypothetical protein
MAIVVLVLWMFTAGAGFYLLVTSNLGRARPADATTAAKQAPVGGRATASVTAAAQTAAASSKREMKRAARDRFDPPSLTAAKNAPMVPGLRPLLEFAHPACAIVGLGFWLGYTFIHYRTLGWIAFALVTVTACLGLSWFAANTRAAGRRDATSRAAAGRRPEGEPRPSFSSRLVALHGGAAAVIFALAALTIFVLRR